MSDKQDRDELIAAIENENAVELRAAGISLTGPGKAAADKADKAAADKADKAAADKAAADKAAEGPFNDTEKPPDGDVVIDRTRRSIDRKLERFLTRHEADEDPYEKMARGEDLSDAQQGDINLKGNLEAYRRDILGQE